MIKIDYVDHMGSDLSVVNSARVSFGVEKKSVDDKDEKLINYLAKNSHMTPFEHCVLTVKVSCPIFIRSQIMRHRTFSYNEISRRYTSKDVETYLPPLNDYRSQSKYNKQCSDNKLDRESRNNCYLAIKHSNLAAYNMYKHLLEMGLCREQARMVLPQSTMTEFFMTGNLRNFVHFINLRSHNTAQKEVRTVSDQISSIIEEKFPVSFKALKLD